METKIEDLKSTIESILSIEIDSNELELLDDKMYTKNDFYVQIDGAEYRFINEDAIWWIYQEEQKDLINECYLGGVELPSWLEIDWEKTCENVYSSDGYGHHFSSYDGSEEFFNIDGEGWYMFKI